jgi:hypothetical protein
VRPLNANDVNEEVTIMATPGHRSHFTLEENQALDGSGAPTSIHPASRA